MRREERRKKLRVEGGEGGVERVNKGEETKKDIDCDKRDIRHHHHHHQHWTGRSSRLLAGTYFLIHGHIRPQHCPKSFKSFSPPSGLRSPCSLPSSWRSSSLWWGQRHESSEINLTGSVFPGLALLHYGARGKNGLARCRRQSRQQALRVAVDTVTKNIALQVKLISLELQQLLFPTSIKATHCLLWVSSNTCIIGSMLHPALHLCMKMLILPLWLSELAYCTSMEPWKRPW